MIIRSFVKFACWFPWLFPQYNDISWPCSSHRKSPMTGGAAGDLRCVRNTGNLWSGWTALFQPSAAPSFDLLTIAQKMLKHSMMVHWCNYVLPFCIFRKCTVVYPPAFLEKLVPDKPPWRPSTCFAASSVLEAPVANPPWMQNHRGTSPGRSRCRELVTQATLNVEGKWIRSCCYLLLLVPICMSAWHFGSSRCVYIHMHR
jgi:hypothetical protein